MTPARGGAWTEPSEVVALLRKRWDRGDYLLRHARGVEWDPVGLPLRGPTPVDLADDLAAVQQWVARWRSAYPRHLRLETRRIGGRVVGVNEVPVRAWVEDEASAWALLGVGRNVARLDALLAETAATVAGLELWAREHPKDLLHHAAVWTALLGVVAWVLAHDGPPVYLRQVDVPGVDTKFIEAHRGILAALLDAVLPPERVDPGAAASDLVRRFAFLAKPELVRIRTLDPAVVLPGGFTDLTVRLDELARTPLPGARILIVENEVTYLALPVAQRTLAVLGGGYGVRRLAQVRWLRDVELCYWGDLDTHGFAILNELRAHLPHVRSLLMDLPTLLAHRDHWVREPSPAKAVLPNLSADEQEAYAALRRDVYGPAVRLEQERIRFGVLERALRNGAPSAP